MNLDQEWFLDEAIDDEQGVGRVLAVRKQLRELAYGQFFNNPTNPVKPSRSTVGVVALVSPEWLVEVEAFAVYPPKH